MTAYEGIVRALLKGRACVEGVATDPDEAYRILGADLERLLLCEWCGEPAGDHEGWRHDYRTPGP